MMMSEEYLTATRASGLAAYSTAAICCAIAWARTRPSKRTSQLAAVLAIIESGLVLDMAFNWRWRLHQLFMDVALQAHRYDARQVPQSIAVSLLVGLLILGLLCSWRFLHGRPGILLAVAGVLLSLVVWCVEVVSLHALDDVFYHRVGKFMSVSLLWILASLMTSIGILAGSRRMSDGTA